MKFCGKCGASMEDNAKFCTSCGEPQEITNDPVESLKGGVVVLKDGIMKNRKKIGKIAGIAVAAVLVLIILSKLFTPGYEKAVKKFFNALVDQNIDKMMDRMPDFMTEDMDDDEIKEAQKLLKNELSGVKISFKIKDSEKLDKDEIESLEKSIEFLYDEEVNIKKAYHVSVELTMKIDGDKESETLSVISIKIGSKWYVYTSLDF